MGLDHRFGHFYTMPGMETRPTPQRSWGLVCRSRFLRDIPVAATMIKAKKY